MSNEGYILSGWQFKDESVAIVVVRGQRLNCFGFISRQNQLNNATTDESIKAAFIVDQLETLSW